MSESASVSETAFSSQENSLNSHDTGDLPLMLTAYQDEQQRHKSKALPHLPSHRFRFSVWHDLTKTDVNGSELKAPRVRNGPPIKEELFYKLRDENNRRVHHARRGRERKNYQDTTENWEQAKVCNLSYQELGHQYQKDNFLRVLKRLKQVEELNLMHDALTDLSAVTLPECRLLNMPENYISSFKKLPRMKKIEHMNLEDNDIENLSGLDYFKNSPLKTLYLQRNPITFTLNYRPRIFSKLPNLEMLDGLPKMEEDSIFHDEPPDEQDSCCIL